MPAPYIPNRDGDFDTWLANFSTLLTASPATYGLTGTDATNVAGVQSTWHTAYLAATSGSTRGPMTIAAKNTARANALIVVRPLATLIAANQGVSNDDKTAIGVTVRKVTPTPIPTPITSPILNVIAATPLQHTVRASDQNSPDLRAKPFGAMQLQLFCTVSATAIVDPNVLLFKGVYTKQPMGVNFSSGDAGNTAYYAGRWVTRTGLTGPWSQIVAFTVANGA